MTSERRYFALSNVTLSIATDSGTSLDIGMIQSVEVRDKIETVDLTACGSTLRQDIAIKRHTPTVKGVIKAAQFALIADMLTPTGTKYSAGNLTGIEGTTDFPKKFTVTGHNHSSGGKTMTVVVKNVVFKDIPVMAATYGEWQEWSLEGEGDDITGVEEV